MTAIAWFFIVFTALNLLLSLAVVGLSIVALSREKRWMAGFDARLRERWAVLPSISVVIPAFNEEDSILQSVKSAMKSRYPSLEIVVVNDGSTDSTMALLHAAYTLLPMENSGAVAGGRLSTEPVRGLWSAAEGALLVIDKLNGGKADAINAGINMARSPLVCVVDADTLLERDTLLALAEPFFDNPHMLVAGGFIRLKDSARGFVARSLYWLQQLEYARSYGCFRAGLNVIHANVIISGALGLFRRAAILEVGGYDPLAVGEDMELVLRLHDHYIKKQRPYAISQIGFACCRTASCDQLDLLGRQRVRWQRGLLSSLRAYQHLIFAPQARSVGMIALPYLLAFDVLGPFVEVLGLLFLLSTTLSGLLPGSLLATFGLVLLIGGLNNVLCLTVDAAYLGQQLSWGARLRMLLIGLLEPFAYHWVNLWWRIKGSFIYLTSVQTRTTWTMRGKT
jgi:cellulose synthase/poly-beta-1,6-N-acetylglucosamine synthase-like glycosyltransferase